MIYTSGSTGTPKGVVVEHGALSNLLSAMAERVRLGGPDRLLAVTTIGFDIAALELYLPLVAGAGVVLAPRAVVQEPAALLRLLEASGACVMQATPTLWQALVAELDGAAASGASPPADGLPPDGLPADCLRGVALLCGGEALPASLARALCGRGASLLNLYGPTETTIWSAAQAMTAADCAGAGTAADCGSSSPPPIGRPLGNTAVYVLDAGLAPLPAGVAGELYIAGSGLARGYLGRQALTAERFVADPHGPAGSRMYRTGDLARWRGDPRSQPGAGGVLEFLGRADTQLKLRGQRIEPGEIEAALLRQAGVAQAVVVARPAPEGGAPVGEGLRLVGYVVAAQALGLEAVRLDGAALRASLSASLPEVMVPSAIVELERLPVLANGKLDRGALPEPEVLGEPDYRAPRGPREQILCTLFAEVLGVARVGLDDDFFALGGHSLLAIRLIGRVRAALGVELSIRSLFEAPRVAALAARLSQAAGLPDAAPGRPALAAGARPSELPLSYAQRRLWFLERLEGGAAGGEGGAAGGAAAGKVSHYTMPLAARLCGALDRAALALALEDVVARHESLRTRFPDRLGVPRQEIVPVQDARLALAVERIEEGALASALTEAARRGFELANELPLRAQLYELSGDEHVLLLVLHHIAGDGWSQGVLWRDLARCYAARLAGRAPVLPALPVQYADYTLWQQAALGSAADAGSALGRELGYWTERLRDLPEQIELPADRARPAVASHRGGSVPLHLGAALHGRLLALGRASGASLFMVLQAGLAALLTRLGAGTDIALGSPVAGRGEAALDDLVGLFVNTLVLRTDTAGNPPFAELVARVRAGNLAAYGHAQAPFERLVEALNPARSLSRHPLFQVMLAFESEGAAAPALAGLDVRFEAVAPATAKFDLAVALLERRDPSGAPAGIVGTLDYAADLFDRDTVVGLGERLIRLLEGAVADPGRRIGSLELLSAPERHRLLVDWNATARPVAPSLLPELFARQAQRSPEAVAVIAPADGFEERRLSYGELEARSNQLAHHLRGLGVGPETVVGLCLERTPSLLIGLLGILKAGGAYLPLDPSYPVERLSFMLADAGATVLLSEAALLARLPDGFGATNSGSDRFAQDRPLNAGSAPERLQSGQRLVRLDADWPRIARHPIAAPALALEPRHPAYVIYTSGSTGTPKGVVVEHGSLGNKITALSEQFQVGPGFRTALFISCSFDASIEQALASA